MGVTLEIRHHDICKLCLTIWVISFLEVSTEAQCSVIGIYDSFQTDEFFLSAKGKINSLIDLKLVSVSLEDEKSAQDTFDENFGDEIILVVDNTAGGWTYGRRKSANQSVPYIHVQSSVYQWMEAADQLLKVVNATEAALLFSRDTMLEEALYYLVEGSVVRVIVLSGVSNNSIATLKKMRPAPAYYVMFGNGKETMEMFNKAVESKIVKRDSRWTIVVTEPGGDFDGSKIPADINVIVMTTAKNLCSAVLRGANQSGDEACKANFLISPPMIEHSINVAMQVMKNEQQCKPISQSDFVNFYKNFGNELKLSWDSMNWESQKQMIIPNIEILVQEKKNNFSKVIGTWTTAKKLQLNSNYQKQTIKRYFKVGTVQALPWFDLDSDNKPFGYCVELTQKLSEKMNFDFDFVIPEDRQYGGRDANGTWNGLVGDLSSGRTDLIVAPLTMTSEREEVVDFVAPYFDQSGISIVMRKKVKEENLFKFMFVLRPEVWFSIIAALIVTGVMIWLLDKFSPYSAQNSPESYQEPFRKFTLKESFWFALTSFTPQGGGEAPKALSGRTLVAAYWLFVVLMLATFTANLAAFLTVERMQAAVSSLEELAGQSKINYTAQQSSAVLQYFVNMAAAEDKLYK